MIKYRTLQKVVTLYGDKRSAKDKEVLMIIEYDTETGAWIPSSLTDYIWCYYSSSAITTQESVGLLICDFMNYLIEHTYLGEDRVFDILKNDGLYGLNFIHGAKFLNYLSNDKENNYSTVIRKENELMYFYDFLHKRKITKEEIRVEVEVTKKKTPEGLVKRRTKAKRGDLVFVNPFKTCAVYIKYPPKDCKRKTKLEDMRQADWELLLEVAEDITPDIAVGVAFQFMGGVREGEVVNLIINSFKIEKDANRILLNIKDNQDELFKPRNIKTDKSQVKKPRENQPVFNFNGDLFKILENHLNRLNELPKSNTRALFIDSNGNPMSGEVYARRFKVLKEAFLNKLGERKPALEKEYRQKRWASHIGRHIYTNHLIKKGIVNDASGLPCARTLANLRGDSYIYSSMTYIDTTSVLEQIQNRLNQLSEIAAE